MKWLKKIKNQIYHYKERQLHTDKREKRENIYNRILSYTILNYFEFDSPGLRTYMQQEIINCW
jgi:hypothetical protein